MPSDFSEDPELRRAFERAVAATMKAFEWLEERGLYPERDENGGVRIAGPGGEGSSAEFMERARKYDPVVERLLQKNDTPLGRAVAGEAMDRHEEGRG